MPTPVISTITLASTLLLAAGRPQSVQISGEQVWISDPKIIDVRPLGSQRALLVSKGNFGEVFIYGLRDPAINRVVVTTQKNVRALKNCPSLVSSIPGLEATSDGSLLVERLDQPIQKILIRCGFDRLATRDAPALSKAVASVQAELQKIDVSPSQVDISAERLRWRITPSQSERVKKIIGDLVAFSDFEIQLSQLPSTIVFKIDLFEFSKTSGAQSEFKGLSRGQAGISDTRLTGDADLAFIYAQAKSSGRLIASPQLRTIPGKTAEFNSGGEIPIQDAQMIGAKTSWKPYGLKIQITPAAVASPLAAEVATTVQIEYSQPDYGTGTEGIPSLVTRNLKNEFNLAMSQTTLLTSMVQVRRGQSSSGLWGLGLMPLFGAWFQSEKQNRDESEVWFLISPSWATPSLPREISNKWNRYETSG